MAVLHVKHCAKVKGSVSKQISPRMKDIHLVSVQFDKNTQPSVVMIHQFQAVYQLNIVLPEMLVPLGISSTITSSVEVTLARESPSSSFSVTRVRV